MSSVVSAALITILSISNSSHSILRMGTPITSNAGSVSKVVYDNYFNQQYMFSSPGNGKMRAIKVLLPFLDMFYDDNVIPMDHDVVIKNNVNSIMSYNPYYFAEVDLYNGYFESFGRDINSQVSACVFVRDYLVEYFSSIGYGTNQTNEYYDLQYYDEDYLDSAYETNMSLSNMLNENYFVFATFSENDSQHYRFCLILSENTLGYFDIFDLDYGILNTMSTTRLHRVVSFKLNTQHYCSDNYYSYNNFKCMGCGSTQNVHHDHYTDQTTPEPFTHKLLCKLCNEMVSGEHNYTSMRYYNLMYHEKTCGDCGYVAREVHQGGAGGKSCPCRLTNM